ncbi:hypothetical protein F7725_013573 [Dissostichus mawsoni]|uniref:Uncharacterized protein n=1 Tax=Dissostichus mawsoni TaxID=36200 RepID=A0A7J5Y4A2_DISMA|nr:hypothetical protein F7725_013573 [Dissostichus mawsoni]
MDTTQDISKRDQISQVYRYVTIQRDENDNAKDILINEAFLGFVETVDTWCSRHDAIAALRYRYVDIMKALTKIALVSEKREERDEATALKNHMEKFSFIFLVVQQTKYWKT